VGDVKQVIEDQEGARACQQRLTRGEKTLESGRLLSDYAVLRAESTVELLRAFVEGGTGVTATAVRGLQHAPLR